MPPRTSPDFWTMVIVNHLLAGGRHGWLQHALVTQRGLTDAVYAGVSARHGTAYTVGGASLWTAYMYHDTRQHADTLLAVFDAQIERLQAAPVDNATLQRAIMLARTEFYGEWEAGRGDGRTDLLAQFALFDDDPTRINRLDAEFRAITPSRVVSAARKYLQSSNRVVLTLKTRDAVP